MKYRTVANLHPVAEEYFTSLSDIAERMNNYTILEIMSDNIELIVEQTDHQSNMVVIAKEDSDEFEDEIADELSL